MGICFIQNRYLFSYYSYYLRCINRKGICFIQNGYLFSYYSYYLRYINRKGICFIQNGYLFSYYSRIATKKNTSGEVFFQLNLRCNDLVRAVEAMPLHCFLPHLVLEDLACSVHRKAFDEVDVSRDLVLGHVIHDVLLYLLFR